VLAGFKYQMNSKHLFGVSIQFLTLFLTLFLISFSTISKSKAAALDSFCHTTADHDSLYKGKDMDELLPIASVSKIFTSHWGLIALGPNYQFATKVHLTPVDDKVWDLHFQGSRDPYFGKESFHFLISELNKLGITKIRNLSFDENFKTFWNVTSGIVAAGTYELDSPNAETVLRIFDHFKPFLGEYEITQQKAQGLGVQFFSNPQFQVDSFSFVASTEFRRSSNTITRVIKSARLQNILKEMNRNSNNHAANQIFEKMGGAAAFQKFLKTRMNFAKKDVDFINGSGAPLFINEVKTYNKATCKSVLRTILDMRNILLTQKYDLEQVLAVAGGDIDSTVNRRYLNSSTNHALIAKTGTVDPAITLGGMVSTKKGHIVFFYNMKTNGKARDWKNARLQIKTNLTKLINSVYLGSEPLNYQVTSYNPYTPLLASNEPSNSTTINSQASIDGNDALSSRVSLNSKTNLNSEMDFSNFENADLSVSQIPTPEPELLLGSFE